MRLRFLLSLSFVLASGLPIPCLAASVPPGYAVDLIRGDLDFPVAVRFAPDGRVFYLEVHTGQIKIFPDPGYSWASVPVDVAGERGLLGIALHPDFPDSPYVYVYHTHPSPLANRVVRLKDIGGVGVDYTTLLSLPASSSFHHGGRLAFGPDRMLYVTYGDQQAASAAQDNNDVRGKILRLGPGGKPAPGNPFGPTNPAAAKGVRNPFGLCFDPRDGTGYFTENGPECDDEVNLLTLGANYGWATNDACGSQPSGAHPALVTYSPTIAPTGCCLYRGSAYGGHLDGDLFFGSYNDGALRRIVFEPGSVDQVDSVDVFAQFGESVTDVTTGLEGMLWVTTSSGLWRIRPAGVTSVGPPPSGLSFRAGPNPFSGMVSFDLSRDASFQTLQVLDLQGRRVRDWPVSGLPSLAWDGSDELGREVPAGIYFARAQGTNGTVTIRLVRVGR
ncbi:MAG TPA: PQQ-dependent sugar dehydrogenase [Candidatus Limnocylindria bacterium]|nr:PQQ-dependent sugar dehydrogenase [Candidatus Limnocylindria bacterium]